MRETNEPNLLLKRAREKMDVAEELLDNERYADSVSRAYYGMLFAARACLTSKDIHPKTQKGVISQFALNFVKQGPMDKKVFALFSRAQEDREEADYSILVDISREEADKVVDGASVFIEECERILD